MLILRFQKLYGMENITTVEVMEKLNMFQSKFGKIDQFGWGDLERVSADAGTQFTSTKLKDECQTFRVCLTLASPEHQEMNGKVEWVQLRTLLWYMLEFRKYMFISH